MCCYRSMVQTRGIRPSMLLTTVVPPPHMRIPYTAHVTNDEVRRRTCQPSATSRRDGYVYSATLLEPTHQSRPTTHVFSEQPSTVSRQTGNARDQHEPGFERLNSSSISTTYASTRRGSERRVVSKWRPLVETAMSFQGHLDDYGDVVRRCV